MAKASNPYLTSAGHVSDEEQSLVRVHGDTIVHLLAQTAAVLLRHSLGHRHGGHSAGLRAANLPPRGVPGLRQVLSDLGGLPRAGFPDDNQDLVVVDGLREENRINGRRR